MKENEQYAYFDIHGDFDPEEVTARIGIQPTQSWKKGDRTPRGDHRRIFSRWSLELRLPRTDKLEVHIADVLAQLESHSIAFEELSRAYRGTMQLVGYFWAEFPGLHFDAPIVTGLAKFGLAIDFDFYGLYSHRREDTGFTFDPDAY